MTLPLVSVVVPVYNLAHYLKPCIDNILNQSYENLEVVIVDDGSTDNTKEVAKFYTEKYEFIRYIYQENKGYPSAHKRGVEEAKGEFVIVIDPDDYWTYENLITDQVQLMLKNSNLGLVFADMKIVDEEGQIINPSFRKTHPFHRGKVLKKLLDYDFIPLGTALMRKKVVLSVGNFYTGIPYMQDYLLFLRIARDYEVDYIENIALAYRKHNNNISNNLVRMAQNTIETIKILLEESPVLKKELGFLFISSLFSKKYFKLARAYVYTDRILESIPKYLISIFYNPLNIKSYIGILEALVRIVLRRNFQRKNNVVRRK
jgi:glycosyltransferase involved in cell wall biosynthesis